ncbi:unnamed protein product [Tuber melanosporum]|uniref:ferric-chelate reductase (NADPH) n=1 Tax=Tuber melanosporum (strain Mel28) TaxID=656061 RepID=D5G7P2_TUBMM|nr:uncharacterized protein GSTUM_00004663001 [Tuber melanosporum]CAZ80535.1 unnamed protein product [Tuber melanosporum]
MSHSGHGSGGSGLFPVPEDTYFAKIYWMFVGGAIGVGVFVHMGELLLYRQRLALPEPARPKNPLIRWYATLTATTREAVYYTAPLTDARGKLSSADSNILWKRAPPLNFPQFGRVLLIAANLALLLSLNFYGWDVNDRRNWEAMAVRTGWITVAQLPLVFLLAGKRNLIGYATGTSYERLNWIHRWVARCMFITATIHLGYFFRTWGRYDYIGRKLEIDIISRRGLGAWCVLLWITLSSFAPIRGWIYELFVAQHVISFIGFIVMVRLHTPEKAHVYVWVPVAIFFTDRALRILYMLYANLAIFHPGRRRGPSGLFTCNATFHALSDKATKVVILDPPFNWNPGQHAFVSCHSLVPLQSHPFTIATLPSDNSLEFVIRTQKGGTEKFSDHACVLPVNRDKSKTVIIDGPYGQVRPLEQFDSVFLLAGGAGAAFIIPLLKDLVRLRRESKPMVTRKIRLVWVVRSSTQISWFAKEIAVAMGTLGEFGGLILEASVYVTCRDSLSAPSSSPPSRNGFLDVADLRAMSTEKAEVVADLKAMPTEKAEVGAVEGNELCNGGHCCCQEVLEDEDAIVEASRSGGKKQVCSCCSQPTVPHPNIPEMMADTDPAGMQTRDSTSSKNRIAPPPHLPPEHVFSGRPAIEVLMNKELEKALGESAVVVCGPAELIEKTRQVVVALSDERAVHKGTGAQGVSLSLPIIVCLVAY